MAGSEKVLVYHYRGNTSLQVKTKAEVDAKIEKSGGALQATTKTLEPGSSNVRILEKDLRTPEQQEAWDSKPNSEAEVASVKIPFVVRMFGKYKELMILSDAKVADGK